MTLLPSLQTERKAAPVVSQSIADLNGYTVVDRSFVVPSNYGRVSHIGLYSDAPRSWRPKLFYRHYRAIEAIYSHESVVSHPGGGWQWVLVPQFIGLNGALPVHAGGYFAVGSGTTLAAVGPRAEKYGDIGVGLHTFQPDNIDVEAPVPAFGVRLHGLKTEASFFTHFDRTGVNDGCGSWAQSQSIFGSVFQMSGWANNDDNHRDVMGDLALHLFVNEVGCRLGLQGQQTFRAADLRNARVTLRLRGTNYNPGQSIMVPWIQGPHIGDLTKFAPWALTGISLNDALTNGDWVERDFTFDPAGPATFCGSNANKPSSLARYHFQDYEPTLANCENFLFMSHRPIGAAAPTGLIDWDYLGITCQSIE